MDTTTELPEWCRADIENAIADAAMGWALHHVDRAWSERAMGALPGDQLEWVRASLSQDAEAVVQAVIARLQGVGVPFSGATGA